ncbi:hypothetical protein BGW37DRAFT_429082 [Umbelopsis sp. PMI_123]|nr:hypothetical protein BGW37DRAFT_429082 [Umbelopsis sp. PMI_123]
MTHPLDPVANEPPSTESQDKEPIQGQLKSRKPLGVSFLDTKVANAAVTVGNGRGYVKPVNGIQTKGFAQSAQRRSSLQTLGSIERLQEFYSKKSLKHNKSGMLGFSLAKLSEEPEDLDRLPTPVAPPPSWHNLDVETDLDVLMQHMFDDIEIMLTAWAIIVGPPSESEQVQVLPLLQTVTEMLNSVKNYILHRHDLTEFAMNQLRSEALKVLETMSHLETKYRSLEDGNSTTEGYLYNTSDFGMLDQERAALLAYLDSVEKYALNPPHHVGSPYAGYSAEIKKLMIKASGPGPQGCTSSINLDGLKASRWVDRKADWESELGV